MWRIKVCAGLLAALIVLWPAAQLSAFRGRGGGGFRGGGFGGGMRGGGFGGGMRPGGMGGMGGYRGGMPSFNRTPSMGGMGGMRGGNFGGGMNRPNIDFGNRGNFGGGMNRPNIDLGNRGGFDRGDFGGRANNIGIGDRPGIGSRPNVGIGDRPGIGSRPNVGIGGRPGIGDRPIAGDRANWGDRNWNNWPGHGGYWAGYHNGWVHGYWHGWNNGFWGGWGLGGLTGWGLGAWAWGAPYYTWGYAPYFNPYYAAQPAVANAVPTDASTYVYDYSQPIDSEATPPEQSVTDQAVGVFDQARDAFMRNDYDQALSLVNQALAKLPQDTALHEFLALVYFAQGKYDQGAAVLYAVLSVGPGWDWATLIGLYPGIDVYTKQLRACEEFRNQHPNNPAPHFVLAYHYMTQGHPDAAITELKAIVKLQPRDTLSAQLLAQLEARQDQPTGAPGVAAAAAPTPDQDAAPGQTFPIAGTWKAQPSPDTKITLTIGDDGKFTWAVNQKGQTRAMKGESTFGNNLLTLAADVGGTMAGRVTWTDAGHFNFKVGGAGPADPGLAFSR